MSTVAHRLSNVIAAGVPITHCAYYTGENACNQVATYVLYAADCGCFHIRNLSECIGHGACAEHAAVARAEGRVVQVRTSEGEK